MKRRSAEIADFDSHFVGGADTFLYKGTNGRWRDVLTAEELDRFDRRSQELLTTGRDRLDNLLVRPLSVSNRGSRA